MVRMQVLPIDMFERQPRDPQLFEAVQQFCEQEFGHRIDVLRFSRVWAVVERVDGVELPRIHAVGAICQAIDCPIFHVQAEDDQDEREHAREVRDLLMGRMAGAIQDSYGVGTEVGVFVAPEKQRFWAGFLRLIGAKPANRYIVKV